MNDFFALIKVIVNVIVTILTLPVTLSNYLATVLVNVPAFALLIHPDVSVVVLFLVSFGVIALILPLVRDFF